MIEQRRRPDTRCVVTRGLAVAAGTIEYDHTICSGKCRGRKVYLASQGSSAVVGGSSTSDVLLLA
jgi:hypothetical protein